MAERLQLTAGIAPAEAYEAGCSRATMDLFCPCCLEEPFSLPELVQHAFEDHSHHSRPVVCGLCHKVTRDLKHHLLQHSAMPRGPPSSPSISSPRASKVQPPTACAELEPAKNCLQAGQARGL